MDNYIFKTTTTMKEYNRDKWWIANDIIRTFECTAGTLQEALTAFQNYAEETAYITISRNALKTKKPMYIDTNKGTRQVGYVITGQTDFQDNNYRWSKQYIDLWISIYKKNDIDFETV